SGDIRGVSEVLKESAIEAVEYNKVGLVGVLVPETRTSPQHLLEQDSRSHRTQKHQEFEIGDVDACRQHIDRYHDHRLRSVSKFPDALKRPVDSSGDLGYEGLATIEEFTGLLDELVGMGGVR